MKEYMVSLEKKLSGLDLKGYVYVERPKSILNCMWINYGLKEDDLRAVYASRIVFLTNPSRISLDVELLPTPNSLHEDSSGLYFSEKVEFKDYEDEHELRDEHYFKLRPVKLIGVAGYEVNNKRGIDAVVHTLTLHGFNVRIKDRRRVY